jgi:hypothetical protein
MSEALAIVCGSLIMGTSACGLLILSLVSMGTRAGRLLKARRGAPPEGAPTEDDDEFSVLTFGTCKVLLPDDEEPPALLIRPASSFLIQGLTFEEADRLDRQIDADCDEAYGFVKENGLEFADQEPRDLPGGSYAFVLERQA